MKEHVWIASRGVRLSAMLHKREWVGKGMPVVLCCHGFTGDKIGASQLMLHLAGAIEASGFSALRFDFSGSGESEGSFAEQTTIAGWRTDLVNVVAWVRQQADFGNSPLYLLGHSMGGLIALLYEDHIGLIAGRIVLAPVVAPLENFRDILIGAELWSRSLAGETVANFFNKGFSLGPEFAADLLQHRYAPLAVAQSLQTPLLIVHGSADAVVPFSGSEQLFATYLGTRELQVMEGADHLFTGRHPELHQRVVGWLTRKAAEQPPFCAGL